MDYRENFVVVFQIMELRIGGVKMKRGKISLIISALTILIFAFSGTAFSQIFEKKPSLAGHEYITGEIIVKFKSEVSETTIEKINQRQQVSVAYKSPALGFRRIKIPEDKTVQEMVQLYKRDPNVEYAEPNYIAYAFWVPNDEYYKYQWNFDNPKYGGINMEEAWDLATNPGVGVVVAVIDTGVAYEGYDTYALAPDLGGTSFVQGYDFVNDDSHPNDDEGHGTHVTGTIAQTTNNYIGVTGIAFNCSIMPVKVLDSTGAGTYADVAEGIRFAADNNAQVINLSLGGRYSSETLRLACEYAYNKGALLICASGNDGRNSISYPAAYDKYSVAVGATRYDEKRVYYSNYGNSLDLAAPGGDLKVDQNKDGYKDGILQQTFKSGEPKNFGYYFYQGTSMAAPHVSAVAALVISKGVRGPDNIRHTLQSTAEDKGLAGWDKYYGWGIIDANKALLKATGAI